MTLHARRLIALLGLWLPLGVHAGPVGLPDSARPGAVRPEEEDRQRVPQPPPGEVVEVPPVIDRPLDIDEGPRIIVQRFQLEGVLERPEYGIQLAELEALLEQKRQERPEGFTIGRMQEAADAVTQYYRGKGLILAQAVIPVQTVEQGVVKVQVYEGVLGRVVAEGNKIYSSELLSEPFDDLIGKPVTKQEIESALLTLTDFPGLSIFGVFQPGLKVGEADIVLKVQEEDRFDFAMRVDDHGTPETGRNRFRTTVDWNNITGGADRVILTFQQTYNPKENHFGSIDYERYLGEGFRFGAFATHNAFDVGGEFEEREIAAETDNRGIYLDKTFIRSRQRNLSGRLGLTLKDSITTTRGNPTNRDNLSVFTFRFDYDSVDTQLAGLNFASVEISQGFNDIFGAMGSPARNAALPLGLRPSRRGGPPDRQFAPGMFTKLFAAYSRLQTLTKNQSLLLRGEWQWSDDILVPLEQYTVGGPENVRAFSVAEILWDRALFFSGEYIVNAPFISEQTAFRNRTWGELLQLFLFYDIASGRLNEPLATDRQDYQSFAGAGWGFRFNIPNFIESRFMMAWPTGGNSDPDNDRLPQIWGDFTYRF